MDSPFCDMSIVLRAVIYVIYAVLVLKSSCLFFSILLNKTRCLTAFTLISLLRTQPSNLLQLI